MSFIAILTCFSFPPLSLRSQCCHLSFTTRNYSHSFLCPLFSSSFLSWHNVSLSIIIYLPHSSLLPSPFFFILPHYILSPHFSSSSSTSPPPLVLLFSLHRFIRPTRLCLRSLIPPCPLLSCLSLSSLIPRSLQLIFSPLPLFSLPLFSPTLDTHTLHANHPPPPRPSLRPACLAGLKWLLCCSGEPYLLFRPLGTLAESI